MGTTIALTTACTLRRRGGRPMAGRCRRPVAGPDQKCSSPLPRVAAEAASRGGRYGKIADNMCPGLSQSATTGHPAPAGGVPSARAAVLIASGIEKRFRRKVVLRGVDLAVSPGETVALVGENGCGKTTLMRICAGLLSPDRGSVSVLGRVGYCPQEPGLLDLLTADEHLAYFGAACGMSSVHSIAKGRAILDSFGFSRHERGVSRRLSGGTRQKLNLALALLNDPAVLLLDEPYQGFDRGVYINFWDHVDAWRAEGRAIVIVTHMLAELTRVDRVVELPAPDAIRG